MKPDTTPRICHISTVHPDNDVRILYRECSGLAEAGYKICLIIPSDSKRQINNVEILPLPHIKNRLFRMMILPWLACWKALRFSPSLCHYHDPELMPMGFVLRWVFQKKVVYDIHEAVHRQIMSKAWIPRSMRSFAATLYRLTERVLTVGQVLIVANEKSVDDYQRRVYRVQNYPCFAASGQSTVAMEKIENSKPLLVYVGGVSEIRGSFVYLDLAADLAAAGLNFEMALIGQYDASIGNQMRTRIDENHLHDKVRILGRLAFPEAMAYVRRADIGLCLLLPVPNYKFCLATKILEYMMFRVPVLASDFDVWRKYVTGEDAGRMVDPCDRTAVFEACRAMLEDTSMLKRMGENGNRAIRKKYNWDNEFQVLLRCYEDILGGKKSISK
ncbi:MAG: glycosyltransferase [Sedimentisphaerales bacterium]|nr:glycosyltransferase [Sedimentisphaerales bacterium]